MLCACYYEKEPQILKENSSVKRYLAASGAKIVEVFYQEFSNPSLLAMQ